MLLQPYFDVDTEDIVRRAILAINPLDMSPFITNVPDTVEGTSKKPDLWGPFWIYQTCVFAQFFATSVGTFLLSLGSEHHPYNIEDFAASATVMAAFTFGLPLAVWVVIQYLNLVPSLTWAQTLSLYGYANIIWIPVIVFWGIVGPLLPSTGKLITKCIVLAIGFAISSKFLLSNLRTVIYNAAGDSSVDKSKATLVLLGCALIHLGYVTVLGVL